MKISEIVEKSGLIASTIRYYEKLGIIRNVSKDENGIRMFTEDNLNWICFIKGLKNTKISLQEMIRYADLYYQGNSTIDDRIDLLENHREYLNQTIVQLNAAQDFINQKLNFYNHKKKNPDYKDDHLNCQ